MGGFTFRNRKLTMEIVGKTFEIEVDAKNNELMRQLGKETVDTVKAYQAGEISEKEAINQFSEYINWTLRNDDAYKSIFENREPDLRDCMDVMTYIANEIAQFNRASVPQFQAQRRATART